jgi:sugar lactone lactonase YvrE
VSNHFDSISTSVGRRRFCFLGAASAVATSIGGSNLQAQSSNSSSDSPRLTTGNGEWTYNVAPRWGALPEGKKFGGTHGAIATDKAGNMYVSTQSDTGILVYAPNGQLFRQIATDYPEVHSMHYAVEDGNEVFYTVVQRGTPKENWLFLKMKTDGSILQKITAPAEAGFKTPNEWRITSAVPGPDGSIFIANGYGDSRIFRFDKQGNYKSSFAGKGDADGLCNCSHGLAVDIRYDQPLLLVCDRENFRLSHFDFDGKFVRHVTQHMRRPCQVSFHGENAVVSELQGRVTVLDNNNVPVAFLGDNPNKSQWAGYKLDPNDISAAVFSAAHGCHIDIESNIYVSDWNKTGRITKLQRHAS